MRAVAAYDFSKEPTEVQLAEVRRLLALVQHPASLPRIALPPPPPPPLSRWEHFRAVFK